MKKRFPAFLAGLLTAALVFGLGSAVFAAPGPVTFNTLGLMVKGVPVSAPGEDYVLESGQKVPGVIVYTDESGGGTTYLPARRVAELLGEEVGYDAASNSVTVGKAPAPVPQPTATPAPTPVPTPAPTPVPTPEPVETTVYITATGSKYHRAGCRYLSKSQISITLTDAQASGYTPCSVCRPPSK